MLRIKMGKTSIIIPDDLDEQFRKSVGRVLGYRKGALQQAIIEALRLWMAKHERET